MDNVDWSPSNRAGRVAELTSMAQVGAESRLMQATRDKLRAVRKVLNPLGGKTPDRQQVLDSSTASLQGLAADLVSDNFLIQREAITILDERVTSLLTALDVGETQHVLHYLLLKELHRQQAEKTFTWPAAKAAQDPYEAYVPVVARILSSRTVNLGLWSGALSAAMQIPMHMLLSDRIAMLVQSGLLRTLVNWVGVKGSPNLSAKEEYQRRTSLLTLCGLLIMLQPELDINVEATAELNLLAEHLLAVLDSMRLPKQAQPDDYLCSCASTALLCLSKLPGMAFVESEDQVRVMVSFLLRAEVYARKLWGQGKRLHSPDVNSIFKQGLVEPATDREKHPGSQADSAVDTIMGVLIHCVSTKFALATVVQEAGGVALTLSIIPWFVTHDADQQLAWKVRTALELLNNMVVILGADKVVAGEGIQKLLTLINHMTPHMHRSIFQVAVDAATLLDAVLTHGSDNAAIRIFQQHGGMTLLIRLLHLLVELRTGVSMHCVPHGQCWEHAKHAAEVAMRIFHRALSDEDSALTELMLKEIARSNCMELWPSCLAMDRLLDMQHIVNWTDTDFDCLHTLLLRTLVQLAKWDSNQVFSMRTARGVKLLCDILKHAESVMADLSPDDRYLYLAYSLCDAAELMCSLACMSHSVTNKLRTYGGLKPLLMLPSYFLTDGSPDEENQCALIINFVNDCLIILVNAAVDNMGNCNEMMFTLGAEQRLMQYASHPLMQSVVSSDSGNYKETTEDALSTMYKTCNQDRLAAWKEIQKRRQSATACTEPDHKPAHEAAAKKARRKARRNASKPAQATPSNMQPQPPVDSADAAQHLAVSAHFESKQHDAATPTLTDSSPEPGMADSAEPSEQRSDVGIERLTNGQADAPQAKVLPAQPQQYEAEQDAQQPPAGPQDMMPLGINAQAESSNAASPAMRATPVPTGAPMVVQLSLTQALNAPAAKPKSKPAGNTIGKMGGQRLQDGPAPPNAAPGPMEMRQTQACSGDAAETATQDPFGAELATDESVQTRHASAPVTLASAADVVAAGADAADGTIDADGGAAVPSQLPAAILASDTAMETGVRRMQSAGASCTVNSMSSSSCGTSKLAGGPASISGQLQPLAPTHAASQVASGMDPLPSSDGMATPDLSSSNSPCHTPGALPSHADNPNVVHRGSANLVLDTESGQQQVLIVAQIEGHKENMGAVADAAEGDESDVDADAVYDQVLGMLMSPPRRSRMQDAVEVRSDTHVELTPSSAADDDTAVKTNVNSADPAVHLGMSAPSTTMGGSAGKVIAESAGLRHLHPTGASVVVDPIAAARQQHWLAASPQSNISPVTDACALLPHIVASLELPALLASSSSSTAKEECSEEADEGVALEGEQLLRRIGPERLALFRAALVCPLSQEIMREPVICADGHTYERSCLEEWFVHHNSSPASLQRLDHNLCLPNLALRDVIRMFLGNSGQA